MSYKKILENLKNLPEDERLLASSVYFYYNSDGRRECGCVLGKGLPDLLKGKDPLQKISGEEWSNPTTLNELHIGTLLRSTPEEALEGLTCDEACVLQKMNDSYQCPYDYRSNALINRHARYIFIVNWLERQVAAVEAWSHVDA